MKQNNLLPKAKTIYEDSDIEIVSTGRNYDYIAYIENKNNYPISFNIERENSYYGETESLVICANDWIGLLADDEGYSQLDQIKKGNFKVEEIYKELQPYWNVELKDDNSPYGGTAFANETLLDFLLEIGDTTITTLEQVNKALKECGIKPIKA